MAESIASFANTQPLTLRRHPFDQAPGIVHVTPGQTLGAMLREGAQGAELSELLEVRVGGVEVPRHMWDRLRPKEGTAIHVTGTVAGSGNGWLRAVLMIAVAVFAWWAAPYMVGAYGVTGLAATAANIALVQGALMMLGTLAQPALVPAP